MLLSATLAFGAAVVAANAADTAATTTTAKTTTADPTRSWASAARSGPQARLKTPLRLTGGLPPRSRQLVPALREGERFLRSGGQWSS